MKFTNPKNATPLDPNEVGGLIPSDISTQEQLNEAEQKNIIQARYWALQKKRKDILTETFLRRLHKEMFRYVWRWAGQYRKTEKNVGVSPFSILIEINKLLADASYWIENQIGSWIEIGVKLHHRLVVIHPFPNGNGRHARLYTDVLLFCHGQEPFTWGAKWGKSFIGETEARKKYIQALRRADHRNYDELIKFVSS